MEKYRTLSDAMEAARKRSLIEPLDVHVIESPGSYERGMGDSDRPFYVDTESFVRVFEKLHAVFRNGEEVA